MALALSIALMSACAVPPAPAHLSCIVPTSETDLQNNIGKRIRVVGVAYSFKDGWHLHGDFATFHFCGKVNRWPSDLESQRITIEATLVDYHPSFYRRPLEPGEEDLPVQTNVAPGTFSVAYYLLEGAVQIVKDSSGNEITKTIETSGN
ncbi:MAG: hypothetical protein IT443_11125 [Phycisphaeraceae bacterium]|nr:hypothetical protein [Phycisphaeraceae bacterium]